VENTQHPNSKPVCPLGRRLWGLVGKRTNEFSVLREPRKATINLGADNSHPPRMSGPMALFRTPDFTISRAFLPPDRHHLAPFSSALSSLHPSTNPIQHQLPLTERRTAINCSRLLLARFCRCLDRSDWRAEAFLRVSNPSTHTLILIPWLASPHDTLVHNPPFPRPPQSTLFNSSY
jgi:hypothetical protein